jgi:hypothetical protein
MINRVASLGIIVNSYAVSAPSRKMASLWQHFVYRLFFQPPVEHDGSANILKMAAARKASKRYCVNFANSVISRAS